MNWKLLQPTLIKTAIVIGGFFIAYYLGSCGHDTSKYEQEIVKWKASAEQTLATNVKTTQYVDSLQKKIDAADAKGQQQTVQISKLKKEVATLHVPKPVVDSILALAPDTCKKIVEVAKKLEAENITLTDLVGAQEARDSTRVATINLRGFQIDTLKSQNKTLNDKIAEMTKTVPVYKEPKVLGFIPYPSRLASFLVGGVVGVGGTMAVIYAAKQWQHQ